MTEQRKTMIQEMRYFDDGSVAARSGEHWLVWEPCGGLNEWYTAEDPQVIDWHECEARRFIECEIKSLSRVWSFLRALKSFGRAAALQS